MARVDELRKPVQPIAWKFERQGFKIVDLASVGIWLIREWDPNELSKHIEHLKKLAEADSAVQTAFRARDAMTSKKKNQTGPAKSG